MIHPILLRMRSLALALLLLSIANTARADSDRQVTGRFGFVVAARRNLGALGLRYRSGVLLGVHAGVDAGIENSAWVVGLGWTTLVRGYYFASESSLVDQTVKITETNFGVRLSRELPAAPHHLVMNLGGALTASSSPLEPPSNERRFLGLYSGLGYERRLFGEWAWGIETRYATYLDGPKNMSVFAKLVAGFYK